MTVSPNKDVKVFIGAPAGPLAAGSGYVDADTLAIYALETRNQFSSFGGVVLWDASAAYGVSLVRRWHLRRVSLHLCTANGNFSASIKRALSDDSTPNSPYKLLKLMSP
jgi:chitinase